MERFPQTLCRLAYWRYLRGSSFIDVAVQAACEAMERGCESPDTCRLAGADNDEPEDVVRLLKALARRQQVELPESDRASLWLLRTQYGLERLGLVYELPSRRELFARHVDEVGLTLLAWSSHHAEMDVAEFALQLRNAPDEYNAWLGRLCRLQKPAERTLKGTLGEGLPRGIYSVLSGTAHGDLSDEELMVSTELAGQARRLWGQFLDLVPTD